MKIITKSQLKLKMSKLNFKSLKRFSEWLKLISKSPKLISESPKLISARFLQSGFDWILLKQKPVSNYKDVIIVSSRSNQKSQPHKEPISIKEFPVIKVLFSYLGSAKSTGTRTTAR